MDESRMAGGRTADRQEPANRVDYLRDALPAKTP